MSDEMEGAPKKDTRMLALGLSIAAAVMMIYAALTHRWLANGNKHFEVGFGLRESFECSKSEAGSECTWHTNKELVDSMKQLEAMDPGHEKLQSAAWIPAGWVTLISILLSSLGLLGGAFMGIMKIAKELPIVPTTVALLGGMIGLISGCVFVATKPGPPGMVGVGLSFWLFGIGVVMGIVGAQMLAKVIRPPDPEWTA
jgi:hypothetical protein